MTKKQAHRLYMQLIERKWNAKKRRKIKKQNKKIIEFWEKHSDLLLPY